MLRSEISWKLRQMSIFSFLLFPSIRFTVFVTTGKREREKRSQQASHLSVSLFSRGPFSHFYLIVGGNRSCQTRLFHKEWLEEKKLVAAVNET